MDNSEFQAYTQEIDELVQRVTAMPDEPARTIALQLLQSLMDLHGAVLSRVVELLSQSGDAGRTSLEKLGSDPLICGLLVLYGIHPVPMEERVARALERLSVQLRKQRASASLLGLTDGNARIRVDSNANDHGSSPEKTKQTIEQAILEAAPEVAQITIEGLSSPDFIPVGKIQPAIQPATKEETTYEKSTA